MMLEKVARALAHSYGASIVGPGQSRATREFGWKPDGVHFEQYIEAHWREHLHAAGFAISAMREPSKEMIATGDGDIWRIMIDAALEGTDEPEKLSAQDR